MPLARPLARPLATLAALSAALLAAACADEPTRAAATAEPHHAAMGIAHQGAETGTTGGWADGKTVTFFYNRPFECTQPPSSAAGSGCEVGAEAITPPRGGRIPVLYVLTPLFAPLPDASTLQCPTAGSCINHPGTLDVSRVLGPGAGNIPLPPHSHVIGEEDMQNPQAGWWEIEVVGVTDPAVWQQVVAGKSLERVRELQRAGVGITGDLPSNLFLFFGVRK